MIRFRCAAGHSLSADDNLAGKKGRCPKCQTPFVVPGENGSPSTGSQIAGTSAVRAESSAVLPAQGSGKQIGGGRDVFVFLCPNGHRLNGSPSLKGRAGQCPECGARFRIPTDEDIALAEQNAEEEELGERENELVSAPAEGDTALGRNDGGLEQSQNGVTHPPLGVSGLGYIVSHLWQLRTETSELEIFLNEGEILSPDFYSEVLSSGDFGVFGIQDSDGSYTISVIPWASVRRVGLRRLDDLPVDSFP